jgi:hypothetical protein
MYCGAEGQVWMKQFQDQICNAMLQVPSGEFFVFEERSGNWIMQGIDITEDF